MKHELHIQDLGKMEYKEALEQQRTLQRAVIAQREIDDVSQSYMLLVEHDPAVITVSRRPTAKQHLIATEQELAAAGVEVCTTDRGGDITYHGVGQLVVYPICDLNVLSLRLHGYMRFLESVVIDVLAHFGIEGQRDDCATGVWVDDAKICALGVRVSRWVSMHGFALNVSPTLSHFQLIVPCGLAGRSVTSMHQLLGDACPSMEAVKEVVSGKMREAIAFQVQVQ